MERGFRTYHVSQEKGLFGPVYHVLTAPEERNGSRLYTIETSKRKPNMKVIRHVQPATYANGNMLFPQTQGSSFFPPPYNPSMPAPSTGFGADDHVVATVDLHSMSSKIDVTLCGRSGPATSFVMVRPDPFSDRHRSFDVPSLGQLAWKREDLLKGTHHLLDKGGRVIARYKKHDSIFSGRKRYDFSVPDHPEFAGANLDMIFTTAFATLEYKRRNDNEWDEAAEWFGF